MIETILAAIAVMFVPGYVQKIHLPGSLITAYLLDKAVILGLIIAITLVSNIIRALRFCRDNENNYKSLGISYGLKKGITCGLFALSAYLIISFVPFLRVPFTVISYIPKLEGFVNGFILSFFYLLSYVAIANPIWGTC